MLSILLPLLSLAGLSWLLAKEFKMSPYIAPLCAIGSIVTCLYVSDFFSLMKATGAVLLANGICAFAYYLFKIYQRKMHVSERQVILLLIFICGIAGLYYLNRNAAFINWDEFSHWGTFIKLISSEDTFHLKAKLVRYYFEDYPPGTALFAYFFLRETGYSEPVIFFTHSLILVAGCLPAIGLALRVSYLRGLLAIFACYFLFVVLGQGWSSVLIDQIVGVLFGGAICSYWLLRNSGNYQIFSLIPPLCFLILSKQSGSSFFLLILGLIAVDRIWMLRKEQGLVNKARSLIVIFPVWLIPQSVGSSWIWHVGQEGVKTTFSSVSLKQVFSQFAQCCHTDRELVTVSKFFNVMIGTQEVLASTPGSIFRIAGEQLFRLEVIQGIWKPHGYSHGSIVFYFAALLIFAIALHKKTERPRQLLFLGTLLGAGMAYFMTLLAYYLYVFSEYEGRSITSHVRYLGTYEQGLGLFAIAILLSVPAIKSAKRNIVNLLGVWLLHGAAVDYPKAKAYLINGAAPITQSRSKVRQFLKPFISATRNDEATYVVWQSASIKEVGFEFWMVHHELRPRNTNLFCFSLGAPKYKGDIWSCNKNEDEVRKEFATYKYVVVGSGLASLRAQYPDIFQRAHDGNNAGFFEVVKGAEQRLFLSPLQLN